MDARSNSAAMAACVNADTHFDAEVLLVLGWLARAGALEPAPSVRPPLADLLFGAWARRDSLRLVDALYISLAQHLNVPLLTTDSRLSKAYPGVQMR
jgi:hypothetical protein